MCHSPQPNRTVWYFGVRNHINKLTVKSSIQRRSDRSDTMVSTRGITAICERVLGDAKELEGMLSVFMGSNQECLYTRADGLVRQNATGGAL